MAGMKANINKKNNRHAPSNLSHMNSKLSGFDKLGAWLMYVNFPPWLETPVFLGAGSLRKKLSITWIILDSSK
jgi:hypothetical protein